MIWGRFLLLLQLNRPRGFYFEIEIRETRVYHESKLPKGHYWVLQPDSLTTSCIKSLIWNWGFSSSLVGKKCCNKDKLMYYLIITDPCSNTVLKPHTNISVIIEAEAGIKRGHCLSVFLSQLFFLSADSFTFCSPSQSRVFSGFRLLKSVFK